MRRFSTTSVGGEVFSDSDHTAAKESSAPRSSARARGSMDGVEECLKTGPAVGAAPQSPRGTRFRAIGTHEDAIGVLHDLLVMALVGGSI